MDGSVEGGTRDGCIETYSFLHKDIRLVCFTRQDVNSFTKPESRSNVNGTQLHHLEFHREAVINKV